LESLVTQLFAGQYAGRSVLVTGHTGFKGSWLVSWLQMLGANVTGYSHASRDNTRHFELLRVSIDSCVGDILDQEKLRDHLQRTQPEIVFHLAAQPLVRRSYRYPVQTYLANLIGTLQVYEACRQCNSVRAIVSVTSDKVYENLETAHAYQEADALGGYDMYSSSKACVEIMTASYRRSFLEANELKLVTVRAGNVIGGGDWAEDRLVPDIMRAAEERKPVVIRNPAAVRPWQHVLEPLSGYLTVGQYLLQGRSVPPAVNFGPAPKPIVRVGELAEMLAAMMPAIDLTVYPDPAAPHEAGLLMVDSTRANEQLNWTPVWDAREAISKTADWYLHFFNTGQPLTGNQLMDFVNMARQRQLNWATS
jgi:CDP-glucose 4,6-dehydratase